MNSADHAPTSRPAPKLALLWLIVFALLMVEPAVGEWISQQATSDSQSAAAPQKLQIVILEGEDTLNNIRERTAREPIVQVQDENHRPVAGALVLFTLHSGAGGAGGTIGGATSLSVTTGVDGQAVLHGFVANQTAGSFTVDVQASYHDLTAQTTIHETNSAVSSSSSTEVQQPAAAAGSATAVSEVKKHITKRQILVMSAATAGLIAVVILSVHKSPTTISAGAGTVHP